MIVLGIETSCDETAAAVVKDGRMVLASVVATQFDVHKRYRGVVPELASRKHVENINTVIDKAIHASRQSWDDFDGIAVTVGPGLVGSLLVGKVAAETLGWLHELPCIGVNHIEGHALAALITHPTLKPPFLSLVVSGGHTELIDVRGIGRYKLLGKTRDDAAGEAYDKVAKLLELDFPGGPAVDQLAALGNPSAFAFGRPWLPGTRDFSFSGLKTAVFYAVKKLGKVRLKRRSVRADLCASFQAAVVDVLVGKTIETARGLGRRILVVGGGVAANSELRRRMEKSGRESNINVVLAPPQLCTDNAAMIASAGHFKLSHDGAQVRKLHVNSGFVIQSWRS